MVTIYDINGPVVMNEKRLRLSVQKPGIIKLDINVLDSDAVTKLICIH